MKLKKLLEKAEQLFSPGPGEEEVKKKSLKKLIKRLRKYEKEKKELLKQCDAPEERERLRKKILLAHAQRKKGLTLLDEMKE